MARFSCFFSPKVVGNTFSRMLPESGRIWTIASSVVFILTTSKADEDKRAAYKNHVAGYIIKEKLDSGFDALVSLLDHYWRIVELPEK